MDRPDASGWTPLHIAGMQLTSPILLSLDQYYFTVSAGNDEIVQELVGAGADVNR